MSHLVLGVRRLLLAVLCALSLFLLLAPTSASAALDLEHLDGLELEAMMERGELTSVELTKAYIARIDALNQAGPGLNAVSQLNKAALAEAQRTDALRAEGRSLGPAMGLPVLVKDIIDVKGMATTAGNFSLRNSYPEQDSGVVRRLREHGVVILGKGAPDEWAAWFGANPSGFSNLDGQVLNATDANYETSGSSSGNGAAEAAALSTLSVGTDTNGSIIGPSLYQGDVGLRPTVGLVPDSGIAPLGAAQDTAGPIGHSVGDVALTLSSIVAKDATEEQETSELWGPGVDSETIIPKVPSSTPDYMSALDPEFVRGKRIGYTNKYPVTMEAVEALEEAGAIMVYRPVIGSSLNQTETLNYEVAKGTNAYYRHLGGGAPVKSLQEEIAANEVNPQEALKYGDRRRIEASEVDTSDNSAASVEYRKELVEGKVRSREQIDRMLENDTPGDPSDDMIAILDSLSLELVQPQRAGYPWMNIPMGYSSSMRRAENVLLVGPAYSERDLIGIGYALEQKTKRIKAVGELNPSMYRCAKTDPPEPYAERGDCNPDYETATAAAGGAVSQVDFSLEDASVTELEQKMEAGRLTATELTKAYLSRIAVANANGPSIQAVRQLNPDAVPEAEARDEERAAGGSHGRLLGIPVLVDDGIDATGLNSDGGSIALQDATPKVDSHVVARLKAEGAIILGTANVSELNGLFSSNMPKGYSSLGGQVLLPAATSKDVAGSSGGAASATAAGMAAMTVGTETSTESAEIISTAAANGVVGLKPTVGRVSRAGVMPVARSQDSPGPIARTVEDAALALEAIAGGDSDDPATEGAPPVGGYVGALEADALDGKTIAVVDNSGESAATKAPYDEALDTFTDLGATVLTKPTGTPAANPIEKYEFKRDLNSYLHGLVGGHAHSLNGIVEYNRDHSVEGLKYGQDELEAADDIDLDVPAVAAAYESEREVGREEDRATLDAVLAEADLIAVPEGSSWVKIADRAGYPVLTVPAGFGSTETSNGRNPVGIVFIVGAYEEAELLADGYAFEQATEARQDGPDYDSTTAGVQPLDEAGAGGVPSWTNPSMWRCVPGSSFYSPHDCRPGSVDELVDSVKESPASAAAEDTGAAPTPAKAKLLLGKVKRTGKGTAFVRVQVNGPGYLVATGQGVRKVVRRPQAAKTLWLPVRPKGAKKKALSESGHVRVRVKVGFSLAGGSKVTKVARLTLVKK